MKTVIFIGRERTTLPDVKTLDRESVRMADIVIVMNRPCTLAAVVKHRWAETGVAQVVYEPEV